MKRIICIALIFFTIAATAQPKKYFFWYSKQQKEAERSRNCVPHANLDSGKVVEYTEATERYERPRWEDVIYLGTGTIDECK